MPLLIQQLNADTTFLLTFNSQTSSNTTDAHANSDFTMLIDPWLTGPSPIWHSSFAVSKHTTQPAVQSLDELSKPPDLIIVSQPKNDHCNRETLGTLPKAWEGTIVAVPAAAKKIRSWKLFEDDQIKVVPAYNHKNLATVIKLPCGGLNGGEVTIANIPEPFDLSAVHNAISITYHPPKASGDNSKPLSILYTPHGLSTSLLEPYITYHLRPSNAYPVDVLFHSLNTEANPKLMGGVVSNGAPGGVPIAKMLGAREWIGAHDEEKENGGIATKMIKCKVYSVAEVQELLGREGMQGTRVTKLDVGECMIVEGGKGSDDVDGKGDLTNANARTNGYG